MGTSGGTELKLLAKFILSQSESANRQGRRHVRLRQMFIPIRELLLR